MISIYNNIHLLDISPRQRIYTSSYFILLSGNSAFEFHTRMFFSICYIFTVNVSECFSGGSTSILHSRHPTCWIIKIAREFQQVLPPLVSPAVNGVCHLRRFDKQFNVSQEHLSVAPPDDCFPASLWNLYAVVSALPRPFWVRRSFVDVKVGDASTSATVLQYCCPFPRHKATYSSIYQMANLAPASLFHLVTLSISAAHLP